jgi:hypothetical protein
MCERDFFDKFDAEHALAERSKERSEDSRAASKKTVDESVAVSSEALSMDDTIEATLNHISALQKLVSNSCATLQLPEVLESSANQIKVARGEEQSGARTFKNQTAQLEHMTAEAKKVLHYCNNEVNQEILKRANIEEEVRNSEAELQKAQHQLRLAKDMVKRQNCEMKKCHADLKELKALAVASTQSAACSAQEPQPPSTGTARPKANRPKVAARRVNGPSGATESDDAAGSEVQDSMAERTLTQTSQVSQPRPPNLAHSLVLPPKSRAYAPALAGRPKDDDAWKKFIP